ncbi:MAG TPA: DMT family transporter [Steroidobacteraceae bacterium]|nr:DMT family transporter [Steroidobacteraceae bacterium]
MSNRDRLELLLLGVIWGASFLFMRIAAPEFGAIALVEIRVAVAAVFLAGVLTWRGGMGTLHEAAMPLTIVGVFSSALPFVLFAYATLFITAGTAAVLNASAPLFGALVAFAWLQDRLTSARMIGLAIGFGGVVLLAWDKITFNGGGSTLAILAGLGASLSYGVGVNYTKKKLGQVSPLAAATGSQIAAALLLLPIAIAHWPSAMPSLKSWLSVIVLGLVGTGVANAYYFRLIVRIGPARAIAVTYLVPVFGMLWGLIFLHEPITAGMLTACAVILLGTALATGGVATRARSASRSDGGSRA